MTINLAGFIVSISYDHCVIDLSPNDKSYIIMTESITNIQREKESNLATISVHQRLLFTMDNSRCGCNDFCPLAKWTIVVEHVDIKIFSTTTVHFHRALRKMLITVKPFCKYIP